MRKAGRQEKANTPFSRFPGFLILFLFADDELPVIRVRVFVQSRLTLFVRSIVSGNEQAGQRMLTDGCARAPRPCADLTKNAVENREMRSGGPQAAVPARGMRSVAVTISQADGR
jgi:hypothetical protein